MVGTLVQNTRNNDCRILSATQLAAYTSNQSIIMIVDVHDVENRLDHPFIEVQGTIQSMIALMQIL